ncbi:MAG: hypothetical protein UHG68_08295 [Clostridia bacterium]|nr:hypothetical protein [Clostridia bacterium]
MDQNNERMTLSEQKPTAQDTANGENEKNSVSISPEGMASGGHETDGEQDCYGAVAAYEQDTENTSSEQNVSKDVTVPPQITYEAAVSKKKRGYLRIALIAAALVLLAGIISAAVLIVPIMGSASAIKKTFSAVFFDLDVADAIGNAAQKSGAEVKYEINLPSEACIGDSSFYIGFESCTAPKDGAGSANLTLEYEPDSFELDFYYDEDIFAVGGLYEDSDKYISIPRKDAVSALENSVFHPDSGSAYALDTESYEQLVNALKMYASEHDKETKKELKEINDAFGDILKEWSKQLRPKTSIYFSEDAFCLCKKVSYKLTEDNIGDMIDAVLTQTEESEVFEQYLNYIYILGEEETKKTVTELLEELEDSLDNCELELSYVISKGKVCELDCVIDTNGDTIEVEIDFFYSNNGQCSFDAYILNDPASGSETETELEYRKKTYASSTDIEIDIEQISYSGKSSTTKKFDVEIKYDRDKNTYEIDLGSIDICGDFVLNEKDRKFRLSVDVIEIYGSNLLDSLNGKTFVDISVEGCKDTPKLSVPENVDLFSMAEEDVRSFVRQIPIQELDCVMKGLSEQGLMIELTRDGQIFDETEKHLAKKYQYIAHYERYIIQKQSMGRDYSKKVYIYNDEFDVYYLLAYSSKTGEISVEYAYELTSKIKAAYNEAFTDSDYGLIVRS